MRSTVSLAIVSLGLTLALSPQYGHAQSDRDFLFADLDGHLIIRFAGIGNRELDPSQVYEISNAEFSTMVHDRLHADLQFAAEARDPEWARSMEPEIEQHVKHAGPDFSDILVQCRQASCRAVMQQSGHWTVPAQRAVLDTIQASLDAFIASHPHEFEPVFMITAYYQEYETPHIKAFLRRIEQIPPDGPAGG